MRLGLIGNGAIAKQIASYCDASGGRFEIVGALARHREETPDGRYPIGTSLCELLELDPQLVVECAGHEAVKQYGVPVLEAGINLIIVSIGALHDEAVAFGLQKAAQMGNSRTIFPSGALAGVESLEIAALGGLDRVTLRSSKPPQAWRGTLAEESHDLGRGEGPITIFDGTARDAARKFPRNANVAASVALFGIGFERTRVILVADPNAACNTHTLEAEGGFGRMKAEIQAAPSADNPRTSIMAALSIMKCVISEGSGRTQPDKLPLP